MPRGDKSKYTDKQQREAEHIEKGYEQRGLPEKERPGERGQRLTRYLAAVRSRLGLDGVSLKIASPPEKEAGSAAAAQLMQPRLRREKKRHEPVRIWLKLTSRLHMTSASASALHM